MKRKKIQDDKLAVYNLHTYPSVFFFTLSWHIVPFFIFLPFLIKVSLSVTPNCADWIHLHILRILNYEDVLEIDSTLEINLIPHLFQSLTGKNSWEMVSLDMVVNSPRFPVFDLVKGKQYYFRVRSVNKYGVSDPSELSTPISLGKAQGEIKYVMYR